MKIKAYSITHREQLTSRKKTFQVPSIAMVLHSSEHELFLTAPGEDKLSLRSMVSDESVRNFFSALVAECLDLDDWSARMDFLATYMAEQIDGGLLAKELEAMLNCQERICLSQLRIDTVNRLSG
jgi:hypothetical protein